MGCATALCMVVFKTRVVCGPFQFLEARINILKGGKSALAGVDTFVRFWSSYLDLVHIVSKVKRTTRKTINSQATMNDHQEVSPSTLYKCVIRTTTSGANFADSMLNNPSFDTR